MTAEFQPLNRWWTMSIVVLIGLVSATAPVTADPIGFRVERWQVGDGLPQNTVKSICQTPDGYLWIGTRFGLARYDGARFTVFGTKDGLQDVSSGDMAVDRDGSLWALSMRMVTHQTTNRFKVFKIDELETYSAYGLAPSREGGVWLAAECGLIRVQGNPPVRHPLGSGFTNSAVRGVVEDAQGKVWLAGSEGLLVYDPLTRVTTNAWPVPVRPGSTNYLSALAKRHGGGYWIGTGSGRIYSFRDGTTTEVLNLESFSPAPIVKILEDADGVLWFIADRRRLFRFEQPNLERITTSHGMSDDEVHTVFEDREKNLWVGTEAGGLHRIQRRLIQTWTAANGFVTDPVWSICRGRNGVIWFGTREGVFQLKEGQFTRLYHDDDDPNANEVMCLREDRQGTLWIGTRGRGLKRLKDGRIEGLKTTPSSHDEIQGIFEDRQGTLWISTPQGLVEIRDEKIVGRLTMEDGLPTRAVRASYESRDGRFWVATEKGLAVRSPGSKEFRIYTTTNGLAASFCWSFHEDAEGGIWLGSELGLTWYDGARFHKFTTDPEHGRLFDNVINDVIEDDEGFLWIGCNRGIYRVARKQFREVIEGKRLRLDCHVYGTGDGMLTSETNGEHQPSACRAPDGTIWYPTVKGAVQIYPAIMPFNKLLPPVVIEEVYVSQQRVPTNSPVRFAAGSGREIEFRFTANSLVDPAHVQLRYQLRNFDREPQFDDGGRRKLYTNLKPGSYVFEVTACNNHGEWNHTPATFEFSVAPHIQETPAFLAGLILLGVTAMYMYFRRRLSNLRRINALEREHAVDGERARIASEMHDDLGSRLTQIALLSEMVAKENPSASTDSAPVQQIATASRELFRAMDEVVWAVNPRHDTLDALANYLCQHTQDFLRPSPLRCRLEVPEDLPAARVSADTRHNLFLAFKEALNNVVRHADAREVRVSLALNHANALLSVEDDGLGFDPAQGDGEGDGLASMKRRLAACGGRADVRSRPGSGTSVQFTFPIQPDSPPA